MLRLYPNASSSTRRTRSSFMCYAIRLIGPSRRISTTAVPGGSTIDALEEQLIDAFRNVAAQVPPAKLVYELTSEQ